MLAAIVVGLLVSALAAGSVIIIRAWAQSRHAHERDVPPLIVTSGGSRHVEPVIGLAVRRPTPPAPPYSNDANSRYGPPQGFGPPVILDDSRVSGGEMSPMGTSETVKFQRPGDEPIQILPGRLEVVSGDPKHREIRFVRSPGEPAELILGRDPGKSPQSVALNSETVSRRHARFAFANGRWAVANLSRTNPVVVNDERLADGNIERPLADGDRVELGEVVLRFRSR
jgi:hypothetical protein